MDIQINIEEIKQNLTNLKVKKEQLKNNWKDKVQERYFKEFIFPLEKETSIFIDNLAEMNYLIKDIERKINNIKYY